ncbi:MAG: hypothetical protein IJC19_08360, partial [Clostridia bacterium]|nr:hypothetical protein [Clostridia bacterium]
MEEEKEKKTEFFKRLHANKKKQVFFFVVSMLVLVVVYVPTVLEIRNIRENEIIQKMNISADASVLSGVDELENKNGILELSGWALRLNSKTMNIRLILEDVSDKSNAILLTTQTKVNNISEYFAPEWNFGNCGFTASIKENKLQEEVCYEIVFLLDYEEELEGASESKIQASCKKVSTKKYLF